MDKYKRANLNLWNEKVAIHVKSEFYDVAGFKAGRNTLTSHEREELGEVAGKTLLHLQCHFGLDTMSLAHMGAIPTGMDFSDKAIEQAQALNQELGLNCTFVQSDLYELPKNLTGRFDIVFTSYGVLAWLPDLKGWAEVIAHFLKPGGFFYIAEIHPVSSMLDDEVNTAELKIRYPYFHDPEPIIFETEGTYAEPDAEIKQPVQYEWFHSLGEIINALLGAGLRIEYLHEFDYTVWEQYPFLEKRDDLWHLPETLPKVPLLFSIKASK